MAVPKRLIIEEAIEGVDVSDITGPLDSIVSYLHNLRSRFTRTQGWHGPFSNLRIRDDSEFEDFRLTLVGDRSETDKEYALRVKRRKAYLKRRREKRRG